MTTPVSLLASMTVTRQVAGRMAARMSSASACPLTLDTGTKVTSEGKGCGGARERRQKGHHQMGRKRMDELGAQ